MKTTSIFKLAVAALFLTGCTSDIHLFQEQVYFKSFTYSGNDKELENNKPGNGEMYSVILQGAYSDASICRKGNDYYMITATYSFYPGIAVLHSTDLVNWRQISYALSTERQCLNTSLKTEQGIFPSTIRYDEKADKFYITGTLVGAGGHFVITADDPAGQWSDPQWLYGIGGIHPALFFDTDGKAYLLNVGSPDYVPPYPDYKAVWIQSFNTETMKTEGARQIILAGGDGDGDVMKKKPSWLEAPHLFKIGNYYYLTASEGGRYGNGFTTCIFRSENIYGPYQRYEQNPILTQRRLAPGRENAVVGTGQTDLVDTPQGDWFAVFQGIRPYTPLGDYHQGRETFMMPVKFDDGWLYIIRNGENIPLKIKSPYGTSYKTDTAVFAQYIPHGNFTYHENFKTGELPLQWFYLRTPVTPNPLRDPSLNEGFVMNLEMNNIRSIRHTAFVAIRQMHNFFSAETEMHFIPNAAKEFGGLAVFGGDHNNYELGVTMRDNIVSIVLQNAVYDNIIKKNDIKVQNLGEAFKGRIFLRAEHNQTGYTFQYKFNPEDTFTTLKDSVPADYLSCQKNTLTYGNVIGLYASKEEE